MPRQLSLMGLEEAPAKDRLLFAIYPPPDIAARLPAFVPHGTPHPPDRIHLTLFHLGEYPGLPQPVIAAAEQAAEHIIHSAFDIRFDRVMSFAGKPGNRPFVLVGADGPSAIRSFREALGLAMRQSGLGRWAQSNFTPHMTLLYGGSDLIAEQPVQPVEWRVREFALVHSMLGQGKHAVLKHWELAAT